MILRVVINAQLTKLAFPDGHFEQTNFSPGPFESCVEQESARLAQRTTSLSPAAEDQNALDNLIRRVREELATKRLYTKVVILVWFGRAKYTKILKPYLLRETTAFGGVADSIWLSMSTSTEADFTIGESWVKEHPQTIQLLCSRTAKGCKAGRHDAEVWEELLQPYPDTLFVRVDDDIVFMEKGAVAHLVAHKLFHHNPAFQLHGIALGNIVNHCQLPYLHETIGAFETNRRLGHFGYYDSSWTNSSLAYAQHISFLSNYDAGTLQKYHFPTWDMNRCACERGQHGLSICNAGWYRWCMNFFVVGGLTLRDESVGVAPDKREESWISAYLPRKYGVHTEAVGRALVVHFSYGTQRKNSNETLLNDLLTRYKTISSDAEAQIVSSGPNKERF